MALWTDFNPLCFTVLLQFIEARGHSFLRSTLKVLPQHVSQVEV